MENLTTLDLEVVEELSKILINMMGSENEGDPERERMIKKTYKAFPKEFADSILELARVAAAARAELTEKLQARLGRLRVQ